MNDATGDLIKPSLRLFDNQKNNIRALIRRRRALLTDRVGSGKTVSILYSFAYLYFHKKLSNILVLTPLSAYEKQVWRQDISKFTNLKCIDIEELYKQCGGNQEKLSKLLSYYQVIYGKHTHSKSMHEFVMRLAQQPLLMLVLDEVHAFRNPKSDLTIQMRDIANRVDFVWGLTGSSISKNLEDFYHIVNIIYPWYLGSFLQFRDRYCITQEKVVGRFNGRLRKVQQIIGLKDEEVFKQAIQPIVIAGESFLTVKYNYIDYSLSEEEQAIYRRVASGIAFESDSNVISQDEWIQHLLSGEEVVETKPKINDVNLYSSRFIYLQFCADGILAQDGTQTRIGSTKVSKLLELFRDILQKGQSCLCYFDYYATLDIVNRVIKESDLKCKVLESSGRSVLSVDDITEAKCKQIPHIVLCTKASSESANYPFINHVIFFQIPTTPATFIQMLGRITRKSTLYPDDLNCHIFRSNNIDLYKLLTVSVKAQQMESIQGQENNMPQEYVQTTRAELVDYFKKVLLWLK